MASLTPDDRGLRALLDTSVLVPFAQRCDLQMLAQAGAFIAIWSPWIIAELNQVLTWRWIDRTSDDLSPANRDRCAAAAKVMMTLLLATFDLVDPRPPSAPPWPGLTDVWDHPIWAAAVASRAQYVVSDNWRDSPPRGPDGRHVYQGVEYLTAEAFLSLLVGS